jgi:hypothetical protein
MANLVKGWVHAIMNATPDALELATAVEAIYAEAREQTLEDSAKVCDERQAHYGHMISKGKGTYGTPDYVMDDDWRRWHVEEQAAGTLAYNIRALKKVKT